MGSLGITREIAYKMAWDLLVAACSFWVLFVVPLSLAFAANGTNWVIAFDLVLAAIFTYDTFQINKEKSIKEIFTFSNVLISLPLSSLCLLATGDFKYCVLLFGIKLLRAPSIIKRIMGHIDSLMLPNFAKTICFFFVLFGIIHCLACGWILVENIDAANQMTVYNKAMYWAITTLTTIGYGDITPSTNFGRVYTMVIMLTGVGLYGLLVAQVSTLMISRDKRKEKQQEKMDNLNSFLKHYKIPNKLQHQVFGFYRHLLDKKVNESEQQIINDLPTGLQKEIVTYMNIQPLSSVILFQNCSFNCKKDVSEHLEQIFFEPNEAIISAGEIGDSMFIIGHGSVDVKIEQSSVASLQDGQCFGEMALIEHTTRTADIVASTYCDVYKLSKANFDVILKKHSDLKRNINKIINERQKTAS